jgi:hypothetical protein
MTADFLHASPAERSARLDDVGDFIRRNAEALEWTRELASGLVDYYRGSPTLAAKAINGAVGGMLAGSGTKNRITPPTLHRFAAPGGTKRPNSQLLALLVLFVLGVRDGAVPEECDVAARFAGKPATPALIRNFEKHLGWARPDQPRPDQRHEPQRAEVPENLRQPSPIERVRAVEHNLFYSLTDYFRTGGVAQNGDRPAVTGTYKLWRYSTQYKGEYVLGKVEITDESQHGDGLDSVSVLGGSDPSLSPLRVRIRQMRKPRNNLRGGVEIVEGYFFSFAGGHMMVVREMLTFAPRCTIFQSNRRDVVGSGVDANSIYPAGTDHVVDLIGFAMGMDAGRMFFSPVCLELVDNRDELARLDDMLDVVPEPDVPPRILTTLKHYALHVW